MRLAAGRLRVVVNFSASCKWKSRDEVLYDKARAFVEARYPQWIGVDYYEHRLNSRIATHLAERKAILDVLDGRGRWVGKPIPRWRWHRRRTLERYLRERNRIEKWW